jgi:glutathione peroxidase
VSEFYPGDPAWRSLQPDQRGLEKLQRVRGGTEFNDLGFRSNDFGGQEPGTAEEIVTFCKLTYGVAIGQALAAR